MKTSTANSINSDSRPTKPAVRYVGQTISLYLLGATLVGSLLNGHQFVDQLQAAIWPQPQIAKASPPSLPKRVATARPVRVLVPRLQIDLAVKAGKYQPQTRQWTLNDTDAFYAKPTTPLNKVTGSTLIYGHNLPAVFSRLHGLEPGDWLIVHGRTSNGELRVFSYQLVDSRAVKPTETSIIDYQGTPIVTLQTCSGNWNEKRTLFRFKYVMSSSVMPFKDSRG